MRLGAVQGAARGGRTGSCDGAALRRKGGALRRRFRRRVRPRARRRRRDRAAGFARASQRSRRPRAVEGEGRFTDPTTVAVNGFDIKARRFVIATGSSPAAAGDPGLAETPYLTNETVFDLADCPRHLIVIGAGSAGLELAQAFRRLGAEVTVLEAAAPLAGDDPECAAIVLDGLAREGVLVRSGVEIGRVRRALSRVQVDIAVPVR